MKDKCIDRLANAIRNSDSVDNITTVRLECNFISPEGANTFAGVIHFMHNLTTLNLGHNNIGDSGVIALAHTIEWIPNLKNLDICGNHITDEGAVVLANALGEHPPQHLIEFGIGYNNIRKRGTIALIAVLIRREFASLWFVNMSSNLVCDEDGCVEDLKAMVRNSSRIPFRITVGGVKNCRDIQFAWYDGQDARHKMGVLFSAVPLSVRNHHVFDYRALMFVRPFLLR